MDWLNCSKNNTCTEPWNQSGVYNTVNRDFSVVQKCLFNSLMTQNKKNVQVLNNKDKEETSYVICSSIVK